MAASLAMALFTVTPMQFYAVVVGETLVVAQTDRSAFCDCFFGVAGFDEGVRVIGFANSQPGFVS